MYKTAFSDDIGKYIIYRVLGEGVVNLLSYLRVLIYLGEGNRKYLSWKQ